MKKMIVKNWKRIAAVIMAAIMVVGSVNLSDIVVNAIGTNGYSGNPYYNTNDGYVYAEGDIFGAATHVHLFGRNVTSTAHTHGNVFAIEAFLSEYGTRDGNNVLHNPIPLYDEVSYIQGTLHNIDSSSRINTLVVGSNIFVGGRTDGRYLVNVDGGTRKLDQTDFVYEDNAAIDFNAEFAYLEGLSTQWANASSFTINAQSTGSSDGISWDFRDQNNRYIQLGDDVGRNTTTVLTIPYDVWNGNSLKIHNLDGNTTNRGILVINIDMKGADPGQTLKVSGSGAEIYTTASSDKFGNKEYRTDEYGACRIVYNIIDSSNVNGGCLYEGKFDFGDTPSFGSILAPKAHAVVGAVNGTVIADTIDHVGNESHRMDIWALDTSGGVPAESKVNIVLHKTYNGGIRDADGQDVMDTVFGLYRTESCSGTPIATAEAEWNAGDTSYATVTFTRDFGDLANGETEYYIKEIRTGEHYTLSDEIYTCVIEKTGTNVTVSYQGSANDYFECNNEPRPEGDQPPVSLSYTGTIGLEKIFDGNTSPDKDLLGGTIFTLYEGYDPVADSLDGSNARSAAVKMVNGKAVVEFGLRNITVVEGVEQYYYIAETSTEAPYKVSDNIYEFRVCLNEAKDACVVEYRLIKDADGIHQDAEYIDMATAGYPSCVNTKDSEEPDPTPTPTPGTVDVTIGLTKTYEGLTLSSLGNGVQTFLDGTDFALIEVNENGQTVAGATANTLHPVWDGNDAVVSQKITVTEGETRYYKISETKASDGFEKSGDVCIWKVTCDDAGVVSAEYKMGDAAYTPYAEGDSYPAVINARVPYSGTISLIKTYDDLDLSAMSVDERNKFLNETTFALYDGANDGANQIGNSVHPVWENGQAVVKFELGNTAVGPDGKVYYIRETAASSGYVKSDVVYECRISNVNGRYEVGYRAGNSGTYASAITCNNVKQTVRINPVTVEISKIFSDNFTGLNSAQITQLISETKFTFYDDANLSTANTNDFALQPNPVNSSGTVAYIYNYERALKPGDHFIYYVKETATNTSIYTMDNAVYKIEIAVGQPTVGVADQTITPTVTYTKVGETNPAGNLSFTNTRIPKAQSPATITFTKVFENNFSNVTDQSKIGGIISATRFTLYDAPGCGANDVVAGFSQPTTNRSDGNVKYEYSLVISSLDVDNTYYYYLKETNTDLNYYQRNDATYVVRIKIDSDGKPTVSYAAYTSGTSPENLSYSDTLTIENTQTPAGAPKVLNSPVISFTKEFEGFANYIDGSDIVKATTFTLTAADNAATIGFIRQTPDMNDKGATYYYQLDLSKLDADTYTGGTYYIKENGTDSRYTASKEVLEINIELIDGEAKVTFVNGNTFHNTLVPTDNPQPNPPVTDTPSSPGTPSNPGSSSDSGTPTTPTGSTPGTPATPTTPSAPTTPDTPNTWITPDGKVHYEILIEYEHIDSSSAQEKIEELITNTTIRIIDQDGNDVTENVTQITWDPSRNVAIVTVEAPKPSEGFDTYYVIEDTDPADNELSHSEPGKGFTVAITSEGRVLFQEDGSASPTTEMRFVNVETSVLTSSDAGGSQTLTSMTSAQTGERRLPLAVFGGGMSMIFIAGVVYVFKKKEKIEK